MSDKWIKLIVKTDSEAVEAVSEILYSNGAGGIEIEDPKDFLFQTKNPLDWDYVEEEVFNKNSSDDALVITYFSDEKDIEAIGSIVENVRREVKELESFGLNIGKGEVVIEEVFEKDWAENWKQFYKPYRAGEHIVVKPTWEDYKPVEGDIVIELDPGMAFGTGTHETTSMCIAAMEKCLKKNKKVFDIGCGSGILAICAAKLGAYDCVAIDLDEVAVRVTKENVEKNDCSNIVRVIHGNLADELEGEKADLIVANIIADAIIILAEDVKDLLESDGYFISSGIINDRLNDVKRALEFAGFEIVEIIQKGEWAAIVSRLSPLNYVGWVE